MMEKIELRVIIAGSRSFSDYDLLCDKCIDIICRKIDESKSPATIRIISGTARGADRLGERFAESFRFLLSRFPADWDMYGKSAGYIRNEQMARFAGENHTGMLIAFWDARAREQSI